MSDKISFEADEISFNCKIDKKIIHNLLDFDKDKEGYVTTITFKSPSTGSEFEVWGSDYGYHIDSVLYKEKDALPLGKCETLDEMIKYINKNMPDAFISNIEINHL